VECKSPINGYAAMDFDFASLFAGLLFDDATTTD
jgi:hypothetical protein